MGQFKFLDNGIKYPGRYGLYQYISETFYSILLKTNKRLNEISCTWYHNTKNTLLNGHLILKNFQSAEHIDQRGVRLFYCRFGQGYQNLDEILEPREEIEIFSRNINNLVNRIFFFERTREFVKFFLDEEKIIGYQQQQQQQKMVKYLQLAYKKNLKLFKKKGKN